MLRSTFRFVRVALFAASAWLIAPSGIAGEAKSTVIEMREACSIGHSLGGPGPTITLLALFENGDAEYSLSTNLKYRMSLSVAEVQSVCQRMMPLLDLAPELAAVVSEQDDTEMFWVSVGDRRGSLPRWRIREISTTEGGLDVVEENALPERAWIVLRATDAWATTAFGERYELPLVYEADH